MSKVYVHDLDPFALEFPEFLINALNTIGLSLASPTGIRWYGLAYLAGFYLGYLVMVHYVKKGRSFLNEKQLSDFITYLILGTMAGGRLGYCLFYKPELLTDFRADFPFWGVLAVHEGGMASHGGIAGIAVVCIIMSKYYKAPIPHLGDLVVYGGSLGIFFGRLANFINGELFGRITSEKFAWAVKFPSEMYLWIEKRNIESLKGLYGSVKALAETGTAKLNIMSQEAWFSTVERLKYSGSAESELYRIVDQLIFAVQTGQQSVILALGEALNPRHASQLYQGVLEGLSIFVIIWIMWLKPKKPGLVSGWFLTHYAVARIIGEQFRMPDSHLGFQWLGLTRGQWLSVAMLVMAASYFVYMIRKPGEPILNKELASNKK